MEKITLQQVLPAVFAGGLPGESDVWLSELEFHRGETCLIEADSGRGKSSLCGYLYGYRTDYSGRILFDGQDAGKLGKGEWSRLRCTSLAAMLQDLRLFPELTALENVQLKNSITGHKTREQIVALFEELGIPEKVDAPLAKLSFGQQQRVAFIRMLCQPADFILMDEPVSHLDERNAGIMARLLLDEARGQGAGVIVTSIGKHFDITYDKTYAL